MKIVSIWDSRFASEYNFEFRLVELNHTLVTFAQKYEKFDDSPLLLQNWMHSLETPNYLGKLFPKRGWVWSITVNSVGLWLVDLFGFLKRVLRLLLV